MQRRKCMLQASENRHNAMTPPASASATQKCRRPPAIVLAIFAIAVIVPSSAIPAYGANTRRSSPGRGRLVTPASTSLLSPDQVPQHLRFHTGLTHIYPGGASVASPASPAPAGSTGFYYILHQHQLPHSQPLVQPEVQLHQQNYHQHQKQHQHQKSQHQHEDNLEQQQQQHLRHQQQQSLPDQSQSQPQTGIHPHPHLHSSSTHTIQPRHPHQQPQPQSQPQPQPHLQPQPQPHPFLPQFQNQVQVHPQFQLHKTKQPTGAIEPAGLVGSTPSQPPQPYNGANTAQDSLSGGAEPRHQPKARHSIETEAMFGDIDQYVIPPEFKVYDAVP